MEFHVYFMGFDQLSVLCMFDNFGCMGSFNQPVVIVLVVDAFGCVWVDSGCFG